MQIDGVPTMILAGVEISPNLRLTDLDYADDIALIAENHAELQLVLDRVKSLAAQVGMKINVAVEVYWCRDPVVAVTRGKPTPAKSLCKDCTGVYIQ